MICTIPGVVTQGREWVGQHLSILSIFMVIDAFLRIGTAPELVRLPVLHLAFPGTIEHRLTAGTPLHDWVFHSARRAFHLFVELSSHLLPCFGCWFFFFPSIASGACTCLRRENMRDTSANFTPLLFCSALGRQHPPNNIRQSHP
jgi:hypothetical protein